MALSGLVRLSMQDRRQLGRRIIRPIIGTIMACTGKRVGMRLVRTAAIDLNRPPRTGRMRHASLIWATWPAATVGTDWFGPPRPVGLCPNEGSLGACGQGGGASGRPDRVTPALLSVTGRVSPHAQSIFGS